MLYLGDTDNLLQEHIESDKPMDKEIFGQEQKHLSKTYKRLLEMEEELERDILSLDEKAADEKNDIRDNIRFDYADIETTMETLTEIEVWNRYIDTYNVEAASLAKRLSGVKKLLESPYFAKITLQFDDSEEPESYYIGRAAISENAYEQMVIDWRSPIAEVYYNQENGPTHYTVDDREIPVDLKLRRQFNIEQDKLISYFDTNIAIEDPMLLKSLSQTHTDKMQAITATIQKEQNTVIRYPDVSVLLVEGIAGSGKTSVLLQRIAYLFYRKRKTLRPDQVCLLTLNPVFRDYIDNVLPDMGETNPLTLTWKEFLESAGLSGNLYDYDETESSSLEKIRDELQNTSTGLVNGLRGLVPELTDFTDIKQKETRVISREDILALAARYKQFPLGMRLIQIMSDELLEIAKNKLKNLDLDGNNSEGTAESEKSEENRIENDYGGAISQIKNCRWVNASKVAKRILKTDHITEAEYLYTRLLLTGECDRNMKYVMIDEVQDYTRAQMMIFEKYFPNARFMLLGDEFQAIREGCVTFKELEEMAKEGGKSFVKLPLMTSYRSSPEITEKFSSLLPGDKKMMVSSVQRPGEKVMIKNLSSEDAYASALREIIEEFSKEEGLTAIICRDQFAVEKTVELLGSSSPDIISADAPLPASGAFLIELPLAKGLEFDNCIIADADEDSYPGDTLGRHCLYTAISRATKNLAILSLGKGAITT